MNILNIAAGRVFRHAIAASILVILSGQISAQVTKPTINSVAFMSGCWEIRKPERKSVISEQWMAPMGNAMLGVSRTVRAEKMSGFEFMKLIEDENGITFFARPDGATADTPFKMTEWSKNEAAFENAGNDFPQKIIYKLTAPDTLFARIEGSMNGKISGIDFPYVRVKCG